MKEDMSFLFTKPLRIYELNRIEVDIEHLEILI